jgi:gamma-glutamyltranspeptidase/glutathione hydrolase
MAATSHPLATRAALRALEAGGTAADACVAAAAVLAVCEPMSTGLGGDAFALSWSEGRAEGLNASGRAPARADPDALEAVPTGGPRSVTVPGGVAGWAALLERHGRLGLDRALAPAIDAAERGFAVTPVIAGRWSALTPLLAADAELRRTMLPAPRLGEIVRMPDLGRVLRRIGDEGPDALYRGPVAEAICAASWLEPEDLAAHRVEWVQPLRLAYRDVEVLELPPNGQGVIALEALGLLDGLGPPPPAPDARVHLAAEALKLAFADAARNVGDAPLPDGYLDPGRLAKRRTAIDPARAGSPDPGALPLGGTVYLCAVDEERSACSFIQSVYAGFGAGVGAPGTGIVLQNRGACFTLESGHPNRLAPGRRPYNTIMPGLLLRDGGLWGPFGLMGGHMQPQGHVQVVQALVDDGRDPQEVLDAPRFRLDGGPAGWTLALEEGLTPLAAALRDRGHRVGVERNPIPFGGGQIVLVEGDALLGASEPRKDGLAAGW